MSPLASLDLDAVVDLRGPVQLVDLTGRSGSALVRSPRRTRPALAGEETALPSSLNLAAALVPAVDPDADPDAPLPMASWLTPAEHQAALRRGTRGRAAHVMGRVAAKQAIQAHLAGAGFATIGPDRIQITNDGRGCPTVTIRGARVAARHLRVTIAHTAGVAVAAAALHPGSTPTATLAPPGAGGPGIGIDVEPVEVRSARFERLILTAGEQAMRPVPGDDRDTWLTRLWAAKEAAAKATGRGLEGRPKAFAATAIDGERLRVLDRWIATEVVRFAGIDHVVAVTGAHRTECAWHRS